MLHVTADEIVAVNGQGNASRLSGPIGLTRGIAARDHIPALTKEFEDRLYKCNTSK